MDGDVVRIGATNIKQDEMKGIMNDDMSKTGSCELDIAYGSPTKSFKL